LERKEQVSGKHVTIKDVAEAAGVSLATASRVLTGRGYSSDASREKVNKAIKDLNFKPNDMARMLNLQHTESIGLMIKNIVNPYYSYLANGVLDRVHQMGYHVIVCATDENEQLESEYIDMLMRQRAAGIIAVPTGLNIDHWRQAIDMGVKIIFIDHQIPDLSDVDTIQVDNIRGVHKAMSYLISLGHTRIGLLNGPLSSSTYTDRLAGYLNALNETGMKPDPEMQMSLDPVKDDCATAIDRLLALPKPPTAIFAANNVIANATILALREHNLCIPDDISLIIFDDAPWALINNPPITAVSQPMAAIGHLAMELLDKILLLSEQNSKQPYQKIIISPELIIRSSCASPNSKKR
jgi:LacI family transcriptional regulator